MVLANVTQTGVNGAFFGDYFQLQIDNMFIGFNSK